MIKHLTVCSTRSAFWSQS